MITRMTAFFPILLFSLSCAAQDGWMETTPLGATDWENGYIEAKGQGTSRYLGNRIQEELMAKQAARTTAQARLLEIIKGVRLSGLTTLGTQGAGDTRAASRIKGFLRGAKTVSETTSWHEDQTSRRGEVVMAEVTLRVCISPTCSQTASNLTKASLQKNSENTPSPQQEKAASTGPSAVILDLQQALYLPALAPQIIDEKNRLIYSEESVSPEALTQNGLVHYTKTLAQAQSLPSSGSTPVVIAVQRITKDNKIVISTLDGDKVRNLTALKQGRVIIALD